MFRFENPQLLYGLLLILPLWIAFSAVIQGKKRRFSRLGQPTLILNLTPFYSSGKQYTKAFILFLCFGLLILSIANPQMGTTVKKAERKGIDVMIALDISNSMNCEDIQPSRLMRSKQAIIRLLDKLENDRIGLVVFAGDAFLQLPLTSDYGAAKLFINSISTDDISAQGTAIGKAIELCALNFDPKQENIHNKAILIISDGENHEDNAIGAAKEAASNGIMVNTIGMGLPQGAPIPEYKNGHVSDYKKDQDGNIVITQLNEAMLNEIAQAGKGFYVGANNTSAGVETIFHKMSKLDKVSLEMKNISDYETRYQLSLFIALILLVFEIFIFEKQHKIFNRKNIFGRKQKANPIFVILFFIGFSFLGSTQTSYAQVGKITHSGNRQYLQNNYIQAEEFYRKALKQDSLSARALHNLGNAQYRQKQYEQAAEQYTKALQNPQWEGKERAKTAHNLGNAYVQSQQYEKAITSYKQALRYNPKEENTKYNLAYAQRMLQKQQQSQQNQQNQDKQDKDQQNQQKQSQQNQDQKDKNQKNNSGENPNNNPQDNKQNQAPNNGKMKQADAERMMQALENQEKHTLNKIKKKAVVRGKKTEKDW